MVSDESRPNAYDVSVEHRRFPRVEISGHIQGYVGPVNMRVTVMDLSSGGLSLHTAFDIPIGALLDLRLTPDWGAPLNVSARVVRTRCADGPEGASDHYTGLEFVAHTLGTQRAIERLMADLSAV